MGVCPYEHAYVSADVCLSVCIVTDIKQHRHQSLTSMIFPLAHLSAMFQLVFFN